jgi:hypothetical protein
VRRVESDWRDGEQVPRDARGYDLRLLDARLRMTPDERVRAHERAMALATELRRAGKEHRCGTSKSSSGA